METRFNFDRRLWERFTKLAQPYFYPDVRGGGWSFFGLLTLATYFSFALLFVLVAAITLGSRALVPEFTNRIAPGLAEVIEGILQTPFLFVIIAGLLVPTLGFVSVRHNLRGKWRQWGILAGLLFLLLSVSGLNVVISYVGNFFQTALSEKDQPRFWTFLFVYASVFVVGTPIVVIYRYVRERLGLLWREWMTKRFLNQYFANRAYYDLDSNAANTEIDNPDQRISQDTGSFTRVTLSFLLLILGNVLDLISFTGILFSISRTLTLGLIIYATAGTAVTILFGKRLIGLNFSQLRLEADFRYSLVHVRDNTESIAFYRGEEQETQQVNNRFLGALRNYLSLIKWQRNIDYFTTGYGYLTVIIPSLLVAPRYFAGELRFGDIAQAGFAFGQVLGAVSIIVNQIESIAGFAASINRLGAFDEALIDPGAKYKHQSTIETQIGSQIALREVTVLTPNSERTLVQDLTLTLGSGDCLLVVGPSGCGKSSLLRAVAGLWTNGEGSIQRPDIDQMLFLPQKPYMLLGNLREQILYPHTDSKVSDTDLNLALQQAGLEGLVERVGGFTVEEDWSNYLSLGEQQRLAFTRLFLTKPRYAILDEATSALDVFNEKGLYERLQQMNITYLSVGHRPTLLKYHQVVLELDGKMGWKVLSAQEYGQQLAAVS